MQCITCGKITSYLLSNETQPPTLSYPHNGERCNSNLFKITWNYLVFEVCWLFKPLPETQTQRSVSHFQRPCIFWNRMSTSVRRSWSKINKSTIATDTLETTGSYQWVCELLFSPSNSTLFVSRSFENRSITHMEANSKISLECQASTSVIGMDIKAITEQYLAVLITTG